MPLQLSAQSPSPLDPDQSSQVDRLVAQLTPYQLMWVAGYLTCLSASGVKPAALAPASGDQKLTILYGSQTGNAKGVATALMERAKAGSIPYELCSMGNFKPKQLKGTTHLVLLVSTHGEGDPPDDAETLHELVCGKKAPKLDGLKYSVLAFGDSSYEFFCQTGKDFDEHLAKAGAERVMDRVDLDVEFEEAAKAWSVKVCEIFAPLLDQSVASAANCDAGVAGAPVTVDYVKSNPFDATVSVSQKITGRNSLDDIRHYEIDLSGSGIRYQPGDVLGLYFKNDPRLISDVLQAVEIDPSESVAGGKNAEEALLEDFELTKLHTKFVKDYAKATTNKELAKIANDAATLKEYAVARQLADVVKQNPAKLDSKTFFSLLRKITPRLYSIASSQSEVGEEVHLTVEVVEYEAYGATHLGGASGYLGRRIEEGDTVKVYIKGNEHFRLPQNPDTLIIMIGQGTGIAPFRAFMQERAANDIGGDSWLVFGAPSFTDDFLYQAEWQEWLKTGQLSRIDLAFSRDQDQKIYVQDCLLKRAAELWQWIERGAHIYVCGDASRMDKEVRRALLEIFEEKGKLSAKQAEDLLKQLRRERRYQRDVY